MSEAQFVAGRQGLASIRIVQGRCERRSRTLNEESRKRVGGEGAILEKKLHKHLQGWNSISVAKWGDHDWEPSSRGNDRVEKSAPKEGGGKGRN